MRLFITSIALFVAASNASAQVLLREHRGDSAEDLFGSTLASLGDVDGDGFPDYIIGTHDNVAPIVNFARVYSGLDGSTLYNLPEGPSFDGFGFAVATAGDMDGDGFADFLVGAPLANGGHGRVYVYSGKTGALRFTLDGLAGGDEFGGALAGVGDVNGDHVPDIAVGAYYADLNGEQSGSVSLFSGVDGALLWTRNGEHAGDVLGGVVASAGDVDLDGRDDMLVSAIGESATGALAGGVWIFSGRDGSTLAHRNGESAGDRFGRSVAKIGDLDGDGIPEFAVGAPFNDVNGSNSGALYVYSPLGGPALITLRGAHPTAQLGFSVAGIGDVDGDGFPDLAAGANLDESSGNPNDDAGSVIVISGHGGAVTATLRGAIGEHFGTTVAGVGDVNADGKADLLVGGIALTAADTRGFARLFSVFSCAPCVPVGAPFCFGDGRDTPCPCGNSTPAGSGRGCAHSFGGAGRIVASGVASIALDTLSLAVDGLPASTTGIFIQGTTRAGLGAGVVFGDGLRCVSGSVLRLGMKTAVNGATAFPGSGDPTISVRAALTAGAVRHYQLWYRNAASFCTSATYNLTNGVTVSWTM